MDKFILGIDIGGTFIKSGIFSCEKKEIIEKRNWATEKDLEKFKDSLLTIIDYFRRKYNFKKVGIGFPGNLNKKGEVIFSPHIPSSIGFNLIKFLHKNFNLEFRVENDANLHALSHFKFSDKEYSDLICITIGTGIGGGVVLNGELLNSSRGIGFELGHINVEVKGEKCSCGKRGCVEAYSSSSGMLNRYGDKKLKEFKNLYNIAKNGDKRALKIIKEGFYYLGVCSGNLINIFSPQVIFYAGGISAIFYEFFDDFINGVKETCLEFLFKLVEFRKSNLSDSGILGAVSLWI